MWKEKKIEEFIKKAGSLGSIPGLSNIQNLMQEFGDIQEELSIIHVAGTNGKGSTCTMLESILRKAGYCTGRYSSPGVFCYEEKYQVNGENISKEELSHIFMEVAEACKRLTERGLPHPTLFEAETAVAFIWFYRKNCRVVLLETGMGGAMDATNIITKPLCSVITSVSMDHMSFLGNSLKEIAGEKAGIIKEGVPLITVKQVPEVNEVLRKTCERKHAKLVVADTDTISNVHYEKEYLRFEWEGYKDIKLSLLGAYQPENAVCAIKTIQQLNKMGFSIHESTIREGLSDAIWPGRFQVLNKHPLLVIDGAHNEDAAKKLRKTLEMGFTNRKIIYIIGVLADKEYGKMLLHMLPLAEKVYTITPDNPRALPGELLCKEAEKHHDHVQFASNPDKAMKLAWKDVRESTEDTMVLAFGSLSYLGAMKQAMEQTVAEKIQS